MLTARRSPPSTALASFLALALAVGCTSNALDYIEASAQDAPTFQNVDTLQGKALASGAARVGVLWRPLPSTGENTILVIQEIKISGSFPDAFRLELAESPPVALAGQHLRGSLVLVDEEAEFGTVVRSRYAGGTDMPFVSEVERIQLGIVSIPPVYAFYASEASGVVIDAVIDNDDPRDPGYHLALFDGTTLLRFREHRNCELAGGIGCGPKPLYELPRALTEQDKLSIIVGGPDDLLNVMRIDPPEAEPTLPVER